MSLYVYTCFEDVCHWVIKQTYKGLHLQKWTHFNIALTRRHILVVDVGTKMDTL